MKGTATPAATSPAWTTRHPYLTRVIAVVATSVVTWIIEIVALAVWAGGIDPKPDFGGNGLLWITTSISTMDMLILPLFFGLFMFAVLPRFVRRRGHSPTFGRDRVILYAATAAVLTFLRVYLFGAIDGLMVLAYSLPPLVGLLTGGELLMRKELKALESGTP